MKMDVSCCANAENGNVYPRVLIVNESAFGSHTATAITLSNLFQAWPRGNIALVHTEATLTDIPISGRSWLLTAADIPVERTVRRLLGGAKRAIVGQAASGLPSGLGASGVLEAQPMRVRIHGVVSAWAALLPFKPSPDFWSWIEEFRPQVIYSMVSSVRTMGLALKAAKRYGLPIVPHFMDDWPSTYYLGVCKEIPRAIMLARLRAVLQKSPVALTIGRAMAEEFGRRYERSFEAFMNCVVVPTECPSAPQNSSKRTKFIFSGGLHLNRWASLVEFGTALVALGEEGIDAELIVYTSAAEIALYGKVLSGIPTVDLRESLSTEELIDNLRTADVLLHVDSFEKATIEYLRYSMSTKLPLYMATGRPIFVYGPEQLASTRYIRESGCGIVVAEQNAALLLEMVRRIATDRDQRQTMGRAAWLTAGVNHDGHTVRARFCRALTVATKSVNTIDRQP